MTGRAKSIVGAFALIIAMGATAIATASWNASKVHFGNGNTDVSLRVVVINGANGSKYQCAVAVTHGTGPSDTPIATAISCDWDLASLNP